jgi:sulfite exporter TauE/SafE
MCGSFTLARNIKQLESTNDHNKKFEWKKFKDSVFYNAGRIISYTLMGIIFGAIGQSFSLLDSSVVSGIFFILIAVLMFIIGLNLTGFFPELKKFNPRLPKKLSNLINKAKGKVDFGFVHGLFTCLMPCGPLYAMYAIASGSGS